MSMPMYILLKLTCIRSTNSGIGLRKSKINRIVDNQQIGKESKDYVQY